MALFSPWRSMIPSPARSGWVLLRQLALWCRCRWRKLDRKTARCPLSGIIVIANRTFLGHEPHFECSRSQIRASLFLHLFVGARGRHDLYTDFRRPRKRRRVTVLIDKC